MSNDKFQKLTAMQKLHIKHFLKEVESVRGRHTELISIYVPSGYELTGKIQQLQQEQGTATNIKSKQTRDAVISSLEKMIQHLKGLEGTPPNGLICFAGNASDREGQTDFKVWSMEPPIQSNQNLYRCDKEFITDPLHELVDDKNIFGLVAMDKREGNIALLKGKNIIPLKTLHSAVPGKHKTGGQCLTKDTNIQLSSGHIIPIKQIHNPLVVTSMDDGRISESDITDKWEVPKTKTFTITTKYPRMQLSCSGDHILFKLTPAGVVEVPADQVRTDDKLIMPEVIHTTGALQTLQAKDYKRYILTTKGLELIQNCRKKRGMTQKELGRQTQLAQTTISTLERGELHLAEHNLRRIFKTLQMSFDSFSEKKLTKTITLPTILDSQTAQFIGYYLGDGSSERDRLTLFEQRKSVAHAYKKIIHSLFAIDSNIKFRADKNYFQTRVYGQPVVKFLEDNFPELQKAITSTVPQKIFESPNAVVAAFLKGLFDAEGYAGSGKVGIGLNNKQLIQQLQMILLRFSIISSMLEYDNKQNEYSNNIRYSLQITEKESLNLFQKHINFTAQDKQQKLNDIISNKTDKSSQRQVCCFGSTIRELLEKHNVLPESFAVANMFLRDKRSMSKTVFKKKFIDAAKNNDLKQEFLHIYNQEILPVTIASIDVKEEATTMIDISTSKQNFVANGLIVHNSAQRFERLREGAAIEFYKRIAGYMQEEFLENQTDIQGIIVGGPGHTKYEFAEGSYITDQLKRKIIAIKDLSYTGDFGLQELLEKSEDVLSEEDVMHEKLLMQRFLEGLAKHPEKMAYGFDDVMHATKLGACDTILVSEVISDSDLEAIEEIAQQMGTTVEVISTETREGAQLKDLGGVGAMLRYALDV